MAKQEDKKNAKRQNPEDHFSKADTFAPKVTAQQEAYKQLDELLSKVKKEAQANFDDAHNFQVEIDYPPGNKHKNDLKTLVAEITKTKIEYRLTGELVFVENQHDTRERYKSVERQLGQLITRGPAEKVTGTVVEQLPEGLAKKVADDHRGEIRTIAKDANALIRTEIMDSSKVQDKIKAGIDVTDDVEKALKQQGFDEEKIKNLEVNFDKKVQGIPDLTSTPPLLTGGSVERIVKDSIHEQITKTAKEEAALGLTSERKDVSQITDKDLQTWIGLARNLEDLERINIQQSALKLNIPDPALDPDGRETEQSRTERARMARSQNPLVQIQDSMLRVATTCGTIFAGCLATSAIVSAPAVSAAAAVAGTLVLGFHVVRQVQLGWKFDTALSSLYIKARDQVASTKSMDAALAWSGVLFKIVRDYNPLPKIFKPERTDLFKDSYETSVTALLDTTRAAAKHAHSKLLEGRTANDPFSYMVRDKQFDDYFAPYQQQFQDLFTRWKTVPSTIQAVTAPIVAIGAINAAAQIYNLVRALQ